MQSNAQTVQAFYAAIGQGDIEAAFANLADNVEWIEMAGSPYGGNFSGAGDIAEHVFMPIARDWDKFVCEPQAIYEAGETVVMTGWYGGVCRQTGKPIRCRVAHVWKLDGGKIAGFEQFTDTKIFADAMS